MMEKALTIAGSDSGGGAGIQQDLKVFSALKTYGASVITAITAQNTMGVQRIDALPTGIISAQIDSVMQDIKPDAVKTGMLSNAGIIRLVREKAAGYGIKNLVIDPVMVSSSGDGLLDEDAIEELRRLLPEAKLSTPNIPEAEILSGVKIKGHADMKKAAEFIGNCLVKGGHLDAVDILCLDGDFHTFKTKKFVKARIHGTGCALSAAITACLAKGFDTVSAVKCAKEYVDDAIGRNLSVGCGLRVMDTAGIKLGRTFTEQKKAQVIEEIENAVKTFIASEHSYKLAPQVGINIAMALPGAGSLQEVAGLTGRLVRDRDRVVPVGEIDYGGSSHIGRIVLTAMKCDPKIRAAMNIRFGDDVLLACRRLGLKTAGFEREKQPPDTSSMEWGTTEAIKKHKTVPDIVYDRGSTGKEAMIRVLGRSAGDVVAKTLKIAESCVNP